jgi:asparagine synthase (glutamine-hydrolysing)
MCGIAGTLNWDGAAADRGTLERMLRAIRHRGPDDQRVWLNGGTGLGHARLSIIDLESGQQPMSNEDGTLLDPASG